MSELSPYSEVYQGRDEAWAIAGEACFKISGENRIFQGKKIVYVNNN